MKKYAKIRRFWRTFRGLILLAAVLMTLLLLIGCGKNIPASDYCLLYRPVYSHPSDTEETKRQIDGNNIVYDTLCDK